MKKDKYKQLKKELIEYGEEYIHIPKKKIIAFFGFIVFGILSYLNLKLIDGDLMKAIFSRSEEITQFSFKAHHLINIYPIMGEYVLILLCIVLLIEIFKKGYRNFWECSRTGLIWGLIWGLIGGLVGGLMGFLFGKTELLISGLIVGLIVGLIFGLCLEYLD